LRALIRVNHGSAWTSATNGHQHGVEHELTLDRGAAAQPTILREKRSITTAKYNQPCQVRM
jgi:hypothetical protein